MKATCFGICHLQANILKTPIKLNYIKTVHANKELLYTAGWEPTIIPTNVVAHKKVFFLISLQYLSETFSF
jgi:hypothetical protein